MRTAIAILVFAASCSSSDVCSTVVSTTRAVRIGAGTHHTCAVLDTGGLRCWGAGGAGQLGYDNGHSIGDDETPVEAGDVPVGERVRDIAAGGYHTCALLVTGAVRCWGMASNGQLGYGEVRTVGNGGLDRDFKPSPSIIEMGDVPLGGRAVALVAGFYHSCALLETGAVRCWGASGITGYGHDEIIGDDETPADAGDVPIGGKVAMLAAGDFHTCALLDTGGVRCWGAGRFGIGYGGQLGYGNEEDIGDDETPADAGDVPLGGPVTAIAAGRMSTCAIGKQGRVRCWGAGDLGYGEIGNVGDDETPASVGDVPLDGAAVELAIEVHRCARLAGGTVRCWSYDPSRIGYGDRAHSTTAADAGDVPIGERVVQLTAGEGFTCAIVERGAVRCWGEGAITRNEPSGQLGYGNSEDVGDDETPACAGDVPL